MVEKRQLLIPGLYFSLFCVNGDKLWLSNTGFVPPIIERTARRRDAKKAREKAISDAVAKRPIQLEL